MPGSGKTTLGKKVAAALQLSFIDLDLEIEKQEQKTIPEIFAQHGEDHFRQVESALLMQRAASLETFVMATGGGAPCFYDGIKFINNSGLSIFFDVPVELLVQRLIQPSGRPLLNAKDTEELTKKLQAIRASRLPYYQQAKISLASPTLERVLEELRK